MTDNRSTAWKPFTRGSADGFSMLELMVAMAVAGLLLSAAVSATYSSRRSFTADQNRTRINQNLRSALALLGNEIRQSGERLPSDFPVLEIVDGTSGAPDRLIVRRNLLDQVLPVCQDLVAGSLDNELAIADSGMTPPQGCVPLPDGDTNGWPDNVDPWRTFRSDRGGATPAYVYNPVSRFGEWFVYDQDGATAVDLGKGNSDTWVYDYPLTEQCRVYALEQRAYELDTGVLRFFLDAGAGAAINVAAEITDFQARAILADGSIVDDFDSSADWTSLLAVEITLTGEATFDGRTLSRSVTSRYFPRNVLSN